MMKVHIFWEGHENWPSIWRLLHYIASNRQSIFVAFLENMNFINVEHI